VRRKLNAPRAGDYVKARVPGHEEPQVVAVLRRYTVDGTFRLRGQNGQDYDGIPLSDIVTGTIAPEPGKAVHSPGRNTRTGR
jgi:hypothetical protein